MQRDFAGFTVSQCMLSRLELRALGETVKLVKGVSVHMLVL